MTSRSSITIGTHNGKFHCDEALACYMLKQLPEYSGATIIRTRDMEVLNSCDIVVDVGGEYDASKHRYDHHQRSFDGTMKSLTGGIKPWTTKLSSAGLVYLHFGKRVLSLIAGSDYDESVIDELYDRVYANFVEEIDAVDNGIADRDGKARYMITSTIGCRVSRLNPSWNDPNQETDNKFVEAMQLVGGEFNDCISRYKTVWLPAREVVHSAISKRFEVDSSGEIIVLSKPCPWAEHLFDLEAKLSIKLPIKFALYPETDSTRWRIQCVPLYPNSFELRLPLLSEWRGLRDADLCKISGIADCIFVHANGFIGGNHSYSGVLHMAQKTLEMSK